MNKVSRYAAARMRCVARRLMSCAQLVHHQPVVSKQLGAAQDCFVGLRLDGPVIHGLSCGLGVVGLHHHKLQRRSPLGYGKFSNGRRRGSLAKVAQQRFVASERECEVVIKDEDDDELHAVLKDRIRNELQGVNVDDVENERREGNIEKVGISELSSSMQDENQDEAERRETVEDRICFLKQLGLSETKLAKLDLHSNDKRRFSVLETSVKKLNDVATFLTEEVGLSKEQAAKCLFMSMGSCSVDACLRPKLEYFKQLGFTKDEIVKLVCLRPVVLKPSKERIADIVKFVQGLGPMDARTIIRSHPQILGLNLEGSMLPVINFLKHDLELNDMQLNQTFKWPNIFTYSVENNLRLKIKYFQSIGISREGVAKMISSSPTVFALNMEQSIKPKIEYLLKVLKKDLSELVEFPGYLTYSLSRRIQPRYEYAKEVGCDFYSLSHFLTCSEEKFRKRCNNRVTALRLGKVAKPRGTATVRVNCKPHLILGTSEKPV